MAVRGEEVSSSIDAHVRESLERLVGEIRSSVEDVREAVDQQLKAALQSIQADVNSISFLPHIQKSLAEFEEGLAGAAAAAPPSGANAGQLKKAIQVVEQGKSQVDILNALLEQCLQFGSRAALLILRGETFNGWKGAGFSVAGGNDETIKRFNAAPGLIPQLDEVLRKEHVVVWDGANLSTRFGVAASERAILVPMVIKDKVAAAVYVDATADDMLKLDPATIQLLVFATGLLVDTVASRKKSPSPSLVDGSESVSAAEPFAGAAPARPAPQAAPPPPRPAPAPVAPAIAESTVAFSAQQVRDLMAVPPKASTTFTPPKEFAPPAAPPRPAPAPAAPPRPAPAPAPAPAHAAHEAGAAHEEKTSTQYVPPPGVAHRTAFGAAQSDEAKRHDEARRFARLLVSEIKLYNEPKVEQGRKNHDLYERMKEDIDRSRQMYDERISEDVRKASNYFYDELVRILADGNGDALGL